MTAIQTKFGWCVSGTPNRDSQNITLSTSLLSQKLEQTQVNSLWELDTIGIRDPVEVLDLKQEEHLIMQNFLKSLWREENGRYIVRLPWKIEGLIPQNNREMATERLKRTTKKLKTSKRFVEYDQVFQDWLKEGLIETCVHRDDKVHYLPHRAVFKPQSSTTPVRPVFDASCKQGRSPALNDCLHKGPNLLELLPALILRFREYLFGVTADIRKAFQMISIDEKDRDFVRMLWWDQKEKDKIVEYRHTRVVFGVNSSPFLLAAVIEYHLTSKPSKIQQKLKRSFYVDNCVTSIDSIQELREFKNVTTKVMTEAGMELRQWCSLEEKGSEAEEGTVPVLGILWDTISDELSFSIPEPEISNTVTKRKILADLNRLFDPIGILAPVLIKPKLLLQELWTTKLGWDQEVTPEVQRRHKDWSTDVIQLRNLKFPRHIKRGKSRLVTNSQIHAFSDASQDAFAAAIFLRLEYSIGPPTVHLIASKARVTPIKKVTIPRLELMGCLIAVRLTKNTVDALDERPNEIFYWTDSTTALAWIKRNDQWGTFVGNRVKEICERSDPSNWRHVSGELNPADLPSRGCNVKCLLKSKWWEGPGWLRERMESWPLKNPECDEEIVQSEQLKRVDLCLMDVEQRPLFLPASSYDRNIRILCWINRWFSRRKSLKSKGRISVEEFGRAELILIKQAQKRHFDHDHSFKLGVFVDEDGLLRCESRVCDEAQTEWTKNPFLLPSKDLLTELLIESYHLRYHHAGALFLVCKLRERFWILKCRRTVQKIVKRCVTCQKLVGKSYSTKPAHLPLNRTDASYAFETTGVDLAGPLYLKDGKKTWFVIFTCAVFRCVHLDLVTTTSTEAFLEALERFVHTRGRPKTMYSDNGTNFVGTENLFSRMNWNQIEDRFAARQIKWIFNPPSAAWWGGWWERLIRLIKDLLKRMLGKSRLNYDQLRTHLSYAESVVNERPLTASTEDPEDLCTLTPAMFLTENPCRVFPESQSSSVNKLSELHAGRNKLREELRQRFRREYLAMMFQGRGSKTRRIPKVGDLVLVGSDNVDRLNWPMGRIAKTFPGTDGEIRVALVKTQRGMLTRPVQRLFPLEGSESEKPVDPTERAEDRSGGAEDGDKKDDVRDADTSSDGADDHPHQTSQTKLKMTRSGRVRKFPRRLLE